RLLVRADHSPLSGVDWRDRQRDIHRHAAFSEPNRVEMLHYLACAEPFEDVLFFLLAVWGQELGNGMSDDLFRPIAENTFRAPVPALDDSVERLPDNRVTRGFDDGREVRR